MFEALRRLEEVGTPVDRVEHVSLDCARGRVLADDLVAAHDVPAFDRSAMDGYAVRSQDTTGAAREAPRRLRPVETVYTGQTPARYLDQGECSEIATGAPLPPGADAIVIVEETDIEGSEVLVFTTARPRQHVVLRASDIAAGQTVLHRGDALTPSRVGVLAAVGTTRVAVYDRPRVAILSTGNEIVQPGESLAPGQVYDINRFTLSAVIDAHGGAPISSPSVEDTLEAIEAAVNAALAADLLVFSGGTSVGTRDLVIDVVERRGTVIFHGIALKPGKPTLLATIAGRPVLGMPGNPTSCLSNAYLLLVPLLRKLAHLPPHRTRSVTAPLAEHVRSTPNRHQIYTMRLVDGRAAPAFKGSGDITSMAYADGYIEIPPGVDAIEEGTIVEVTLF